MVLSWLAGCPYVFGPADFSNVPGPAGTPTGDTARTATGDTGTTPTLPTGATGDTGPAVGPEIVDVVAYPVVDGLRLVLTVLPHDGLEGGALLVDDDGDLVELAIPDEVNALTDELLVATVPVASPCDGIDVRYAVSVRDADGRVGAEVDVEVQVPGLGKLPDAKSGTVDLGLLRPPVLWCGAVDQLSEFDRFDFTVDRDLDVEVVATWDSTADLDLQIRAPPALLDDSTTVVQPAFLHATLAPKTAYQLVVQHFSGPPPSTWLLALTEDPP